MTQKTKKEQTTPLVTDSQKIFMKLIDDFPSHPYYVFDDEDMADLVESIRKNGLISPVIVRKKNDRYELISGHRRKHACELLGHREIACSIVDVTDDDAVIMMVDSNCQRSKVFPSERAFAYKMKLDAMKRQGKRSDLTSAQLAQKLGRKTSRQILAEQQGQSQDMIRRYIRLTNLVPELLEFVDMEKIKLCPAVEISYILMKNHEEIWLTRLMKQRPFRLMHRVSECVRRLSRGNSIMIWSKRSCRKQNQIRSLNIGPPATVFRSTYRQDCWILR